MGYSKLATSTKIECVRRYFFDPDISIRKLAEEKGVNFSKLSYWTKTARKVGLLNPGEARRQISVGTTDLEEIIPHVMSKASFRSLLPRNG